MLTNHINIALRSLLKHKLVSVINIGGLSVGVACSLLISLFVLDELSYDRFLPNSDRVFRLESTTRTPDGTQLNQAAVGWPVGKILRSDYPEVERLTYLKGWSPQLKHKGVYVNETALQADTSFLSVLGYELAQGNPNTALSQPFSVILSPEAEARYFGKGNGMGKVLMVSDTLPHRVTGIFKNVPRTSHLQFSMVRSLASLHTLFPQDMAYEYTSGWFDINVANYVLLKPGVDAHAFATKISGLVKQSGQAMMAQTGMTSTLQLRPLGDIYLHSNMPTINGPVGNSQTIYLFLGIGLFILLIACLNVINLTTARATERAKEVGIRKVLGIQQGQLIAQFLTEAAVVCTTAVGLGLLLAIIVLPVYSALTGKPITVAALVSPASLLLVCTFLLVLIPLTGVYPSLVLTRYQPITVLKGHGPGSRVGASGSGALIRKGLVVVQFAVSICLIVGTLVAWRQVRFMQQQPLGFDQQHVVVVSLKAAMPRQEQIRAFRRTLLTHSQIPLATACLAVPGQEGWDGQLAHGEGNEPGKGTIVEHIPVDQAYTKTLRLDLLAGRDFIPDSKADENESFLVNEAAVRAFGWSTPQRALGRKIAVSGVNGRVVGVLKNYHQHSLQANIRPVVLNVMPVKGVVAFRYEGNSPAAVIDHLEASWKQTFPGFTLTYSFLDDAYQQQYVAEQKLIQTVSAASFLAILIASLGLFGLATFTAEQRRKEIGVRKVLGASVGSIVALLSQDFLKLVLIAIVIASPIAWYAMNRWLQDFAYKITIGWGIFVLAGTLAVGIALLTVSFQSVKAALMNPVKSLRSE